MIPLIGSQCLIVPPPLYLVSNHCFSPPSVPLKTMWSPLHPFFPPVINNDRCFAFNFPRAERCNFTSSAQRTCLQHLVSGKLSLFFHFFLVVVVFVFVSLFGFVFVFVFFLLCSLDAILSKFVYVFIESPVKKMKKPSKPCQKLISLGKVLNRRKL